MKASGKKPNPHDIIKYEIAEELGLIDKIDAMGWKGLTAKESGRIGGLLARRKRELQEQGIRMDVERGGNSDIY